MGKRVLFALCAAAALVAPQPAVAQETTTTTELVVGAQARLSPNDRLTWGPVNVVQRTYDANGTLISEEVPADVGGVSTLASGSYACEADRYPKSLKVYDQWYAEKNTADVYFLYMFQPYLYNDARRVDGQLQDQLEVCGVGGADMKPDRGRLLRTGPSATIMRNATKIIGWKWRVGEDLGNVTATLGFKVGTEKTPVSVTGSVDIVVSDSRNEGAQGYAEDVNTVSDDWPNNAVHAWWESACSALPWCGSHDYEGATVHGLWEFLSGRRGYEDLYAEAYARWH